ncbi:pyocin knob domain-containing protein [Psychrobacter aquimaris]|uniref:pyocin knob domain-containing protein n=1 Tax=Psychrobacter aquimaris TaxID=292733 RepID=UPI003FD25F7D
MAIQIPNPGTGNGQTGDNEFALWSKVKGNFENTTHAASRTVGTMSGNVVEMTADGLGGLGYGGAAPIGAWSDLNLAITSGFYTVSLSTSGGAQNLPAGISGAYGVMQVIQRKPGASSASVVQRLYVNSAGDCHIRVFDGTSGWTAWRRDVVQGNNDIYQLTTAAGANTVIDSSGYLRRSTSSERYKDILADLVLDDAAYANAMQLAPIVYRSTAEADNPDYHYYSFSAEALGAFDPAFTLWRDTETVTDADGNTSEQPLAERVAEGININALLAFSHAIAIKQDKMIRTQAEAIATLTLRIDAMATQ